ncbi:type II toxin-antitoxin system HipA family toxin [Marinihelvus fidelis]|uniref:Type II toxin-antitoxin system HipA family toxin n=1 Tax=Marinihelvus fidelis TaxID=2613842 RepID=A0A5N0TGB7_9GAMM|nr:type II toxin-antitoxin system HipA family toxin [Marinihelvus fidelis]KAA9134090.1 type II toxin-antitoxin system HipA family toxin [Marinihelvus fidelis]
MSTAQVRLWGRTVGYASMDEGEAFGRFEWDPAFVELGINPAPLQMPLQKGRVYQFRELHKRTFHGLPGLLADALPDKYGNALINVWLAKNGRTPEQFNAVDRLCYTGKRAMGALEFEPASAVASPSSQSLQVEQLVELASLAFASRHALQVRLDEGLGDEPLLELLSVGTSAGGARAKAVIAYNPDTHDVRSGQLDLPAGYEHWLIKFDGVKFSGDWGVADPAGYGLLEYSYYQVARECGIDISECQLLEENGRHHFMTRRFDRTEDGKKRFVQSLGALAHFDYYESGHYSYEQLFMTMKQLDMPMQDIEEQYRRAVFNIVGCNQDDHVKNFGFIMNPDGRWRIAPAYDLCHAEGSDFTRFHQLSINGKTTGFDVADLKHLAEYAGLPRNREKIVLERTVEAFRGWAGLAEELSIPEPLRRHVASTLRFT